MTVLSAICAACYAAVLIPFKPIPLIPGFTEIRPANALPIVFSLFFGPAASWGSAFGNLIADFFGTLGFGSIFGFFGNFLYGYLPYRIWNYLTKNKEPILRNFQLWLCYIISVALASVACGMFIAWGVDWIGLLPFSALGNIIAINNFAISVVIGPILLFLLYPRLKRMGLLYSQLLEEKGSGSFLLKSVGFIFLFISCFCGIYFGNLFSLGVIKGTVGLGLLPFIFLLLVSLILL